MNRNNEDYCSPVVPELVESIIEDVKHIFKTSNATFFFIPTTRVGAWENALTNTLSPRDKILTFRLGQFSLLWIDQMQPLNFDVVVIDVDWGIGVELVVFKRKLLADTKHEIKAICVVHNETVSGVTNDLAGIRYVLDI